MTAELLRNLEAEIGSITLVPSDGGRFELTVNGKFLYSKLQTGRHSEPGEILRLVEQYLKENR